MRYAFCWDSLRMPRFKVAWLSLWHQSLRNYRKSMSKWKVRMASKRRPAMIMNPPNKAICPEWWQDGKNLIRLHPSYIERRNYEKKQQKKQ